MADSLASTLALAAKAKLLARGAQVMSKGAKGAVRGAASTAGAAAMQLISDQAGDASAKRDALKAPEKALQDLVAARSQEVGSEARAKIEVQIRQAKQAYNKAYKLATEGPRLVRKAQKAVNDILAKVSGLA